MGFLISLEFSKHFDFLESHLNDSCLQPRSFGFDLIQQFISEAGQVLLHLFQITFNGRLLNSLRVEDKSPDNSFCNSLRTKNCEH